MWESDKNTRKHHTQESQEVSPFPAGDHKAARNRQDIMTDKNETQITNRMHKRSTALERSVTKPLEGLNKFDGISLAHISDVEQDKLMFGSHASSPSTYKTRYKKEIKQR